jgi:teichuronic acid biosynthesis glycosyltransferase TuaC
MKPYTLGLFANMYPAFDGDYRGIFIHQMVRDLESRGVTVKKAVKTSPSVTGYLPFCWKSLLLARDEAPDILQAEYIPHSSLIPAFLKKKGTPLVLKFHGDDARIFPFKNRLNHMLTCSMLRRANHVITASEEMRNILIPLGVKPDQISAIHTGVDTVFFSPLSKKECRNTLGLPHEQTIFLFVGRLHPWKGIREVIDVARGCPGTRFVFLGPGNIPQHPQNCQFLGPRPPAEVREWLNAADCFILPTYTDAVPASVMEAFSCGIPAITTDIGGCPEIVENTVNGLMVPVRNVDKLRDAVIWMQTHPDEREKMGAHARHTVLRKFDHTQLTDKLIDVHQSLI